ncbi:hypothetical protein [Ralstonia mannitolilytica]|uniref:hypothetical protein n=1 Tax=Ralstonia mannitolilytica TaxID=105219 RepID=UPI0026EA14D1|nr:hypothetical protein [Ralstonia mannitolilytica]
MAIEKVDMLPRDAKSLRAVVPRPSATAGASMPVWLRELLAKKAEVRRVAASGAAYREASGGRAARGALATRDARPAAGGVGLSLDDVNAALSAAVDSEFLASRSEAAFCQAGVVAPPDSLTDETSFDSGEGL